MSAYLQYPGVSAALASFGGKSLCFGFGTVLRRGNVIYSVVDFHGTLVY
jgi:hypothetical protein